jgi:CheY-like chemotaxis protein
MMKVMRRAAPFYGRIATPQWLGIPAMARILIVDDEEEMRRVIDIMLKHAGHDTASAEDGHDALLQFRQQRFDLVICDIFMPNKEGLATLRELRRLNPTVPVIMMSGGAEHLVSGNRARRLSRDGEKAWRHPDNQETLQVLAAQ